MYDIPSNAVVFHLNLPFQEKQYCPTVPLKTFAQNVKALQATKKHVPETDVLKFYFYNHAFHMISAKYSPLEAVPKDIEEILEMRTSVIPSICNRVLSHTFLTLLYEMNWLHPSVSNTDRFYLDLENRFGTDLANHFTQGGGGGFAMGKMKNYEQLDVECGDYVRALLTVYTSSNHFNAIAKDKQWIAIASVPYDFFMGRASLEETCDKAFSLFHWGGSIFNKNILYTVNSDEMINLLDVQDSGQIPQWINANLNNKFVDAELKKVFTLFKKHFQDEVSEPVSKKAIQEAKTKREKGAQKVISQRGGGNWNNQQTQKDEPKAPPMQKIDQIVANTFFGKKM